MKLALGCGKKIMPGYIHIDLNDFSHINFQSPIDDLKMFEDNSVDLIYCSHAFEYFDRIQAVNVLKEWNRVLKVGGILRLAVPDFEALAELYVEQRDINKIVGPLYGRWPIASREVFYHKTVWDFTSLSIQLVKSGFDEVKRWDWREVFVGELEGFDDYSRAYQPHMDFDKGRLMSLNVECVKGEAK